MYDECPEGKRGTVEASKIFAQIQNGNRIKYDCVVITGDLGPFSSQNLLYIVKYPITITNSIIQGNVNFENVIFENAVEFRETCFTDQVNFKGSIFKQQCIFEGSHFKEPTHFSDIVRRKRAHFYGYTNFKRTIFEKYVDFRNVVFESGAEFSSLNLEESILNRSVFKGETLFTGAEFKGLAQFTACEFKSVEFRRAKFKKEAYFQNASFNEFASFLQSCFTEFTDFNKATFSGDGGFAEARFNGYFTDFRNVLFLGTFGNFRGSEFNGEFVSFRNAKFRNLNDQELACRKARRQLEKSGNRDEADYNFLSEMEAKRRQKGITKTLHPESPNKIELGAMSFHEFCLYFNDAIKNREWSKIAKGFILQNLLKNIIFQTLFGGYGIFWSRIVFWWIYVSLFMGYLYWVFQGIEGAPCLWQCLYFSFLVMFTRGYGNYTPNSNIFELSVACQTVFGLLMFGIFIASITRKYMR